MAAPSTLNLITQACSVFVEYQPTASDIASLTLLVNQGVESLPLAFTQISTSAQRQMGNTDELTRLFFLLFNRPPDLANYTAAMNMMANGSSLADVCQIGLQSSTSLLSNSLNMTNQQFVVKMGQQMFGANALSIPGVSDAENTLIYQLNSQMISRAQVIALAAQIDSTSLVYHNEIEISLDYLAVTGQPPSQAQMAAAQGVPEHQLLSSIMMSNGIDPYSGNPLFTIAGSKLTLTGNITTSLSIDLSKDTSTLGANSNYRLFASYDAGVSDNSVLFSPSLLSPIHQIDASGLGTTATSFTFQAGSMGSVVQAPNVVSTLTGGSGTDILTAGSVKSTLIAGSGNETLIGGIGNDVLYAGTGINTLTGGAGNDTFVFPSSVAVFQNHAMTTITDFGNGVDVLNLGLLAGNTSSTKPATAIVGSSALGTGFVNTAGALNDSVLLVFNTGQWVDNASAGFVQKTPADIANLFQQSYVITPASGSTPAVTGLEPVVFAKPPSVGAVYFVVSYDPFNGADIWYVNNLAPLTTVTPNEITLVGHLNPTGDLWQALNATGAIVL